MSQIVDFFFAKKIVILTRKLKVIIQYDSYSMIHTPIQENIFLFF